ncbi:hypothetical protein HanRHA438_Chr01g0031581 [Helianthus annuus]|nr:hypothetical protein HanXRQr2_Chr01g0030811 [Helianthus annuus]KAJ0948784.1 hypothetical protein HanRHA438_Chr01g0031581 [Helianthus annuus]
MMARVIFSSIPCSGRRQRQQSWVLLGSRLKTLWVWLTNVTRVNCQPSKAKVARFSFGRTLQSDGVRGS